ncbi:MAG: sialidase family protein [Candidatus Acidiferrales bacterium]
MKSRSWSRVFLGVCAVSLLFASSASAQSNEERLKAIKARLDQMKALYDKLPSLHKQVLGGNRHLIHLASVWDVVASNASKNQPARPRPSGVLGSPAASSGVVAVSDPSTDLEFSSFGGFTQSETHSARCGNSVVVGFNDSGSFLETLPNPSIGLSFSGWGQSLDGGATFHDGGAVPPGSNIFNFLGGDPVVGCANSNTLYYSQIFSTGSLTALLSSMALSKSTDGGATWADPVASVQKDGTLHLLDKDWLAVDPSDPDRLYVSYTDFDSSDLGGSGPCPKDFRTAIEFVTSDDGGSSWSKPIVLDFICGGANAVQGSQIAVGSHGDVHFAWEAFVNFPTGPREIRARSFNPKTGKLGKTVIVDEVIGGGDGFFLQGLFREFLGLSMAIDRSKTPSAGTIYITWDDGRDLVIPDAASPTGTYAYDDILTAISFDGGDTWFGGGRLNTDGQPRFGLGHDHFQPGAAVDKTGKVAVCWYDRRDDPENFAISRFCGTSTNGGATWTNTQVQVPPFAPVHGIDVLISADYMGDYDGLTSDFTGATAGFIGAFQFMGSTANPDVLAVKF